ncbi:MAG: DUF5320 domain-containing protein [bacterium]
MSGFDKTGPMGQGPMTGRGFGPCGFGMGWRKRFGMGKKALTDYKKSLEDVNA